MSNVLSLEILGRSLDQWHQHHLKSVKEAGLESASGQDSRVNASPGTLRLRSYSRQALTKFRLQGADHWHRGVRADQLPSSHFMKTVFSSVPVLLSLKGHDVSAVLFPFKAPAVRFSWCHLCRHRQGAEQQLLIHTAMGNGQPQSAWAHTRQPAPQPQKRLQRTAVISAAQYPTFW